MLELPHDTIVVSFRDALRITDCTLDEGLEAPLEQLIDLVVVVVVVPDAEHTLDVIPNGPPEARGVDFAVRAHCVIRQVVGRLEFIIEKVTDVVVQPVYERVAVIVPRIVLDAESRYVVQLAALQEEHVRGYFRNFRGYLVKMGCFHQRM